VLTTSGFYTFQIFTVLSFDPDAKTSSATGLYCSKVTFLWWPEIYWRGVVRSWV